MVLWENASWAIEAIDSGHVIVTNKHLGWNESPLLFRSRLYWDGIGRVARYVQRKTLAIMRKRAVARAQMSAGESYTHLAWPPRRATGVSMPEAAKWSSVLHTHPGR
jgi:hypothetical protein